MWAMACQPPMHAPNFRRMQQDMMAAVATAMPCTDLCPETDWFAPLFKAQMKRQGAQLEHVQLTQLAPFVNAY